jgi:general secretion pathway protein E
MLHEYFRLEKIIFGPLASRLKLLSNLDIAEKRKPQDGRFTQIVDKNIYDFRVSSLLL